MKKLTAFLLSLMILISVWIVNIGAGEIDENLVLHYDFEGESKAEAYYNKANNGTTQQTGALLAETFSTELEWDDKAGTLAYYGADASGNSPVVPRAYIGSYISGDADFSVFTRFRIAATASAATTSSIRYRFLNAYQNAAKNIQANFIDGASTENENDYFQIIVNNQTYQFTGITFEDMQTGYVNIAVVVYKENGNLYVKMYASKGAGPWAVLTSDNFGSVEAPIPAPAMNMFLIAAERRAGIIMDDFRIYSKALTLAEADSIMKSGNFAPDIRNIGYQYGAGSGEYSMRFVGGIDSLDYDEVGIEITIPEKSPYVKTTTKVYTGIMVGSRAVNASEYYCNYFLAFPIIGISDEVNEVFSYRFFAVKGGVTYYSPFGNAYTKAAYRALNGTTYSSYHEEKLKNNLGTAVRADQELIENLIVRMGNSFAVSNGSSSVLCNGFIRKLDNADYSRNAIISGTTVRVPAEFAESYFGATLEKDENDYVNLTAYLSGNTDYSLYITDDGNLAIITPSEIASFGAGDAAYCNRMLEFLTASVIPEPGNNTEQSRVVIDSRQYPESVLDYTTFRYQTTYSPSIVVVDNGGKSVYYVSYEVSTVVWYNSGADYEELETYTVVKKSADGGETWVTVVEKIPDLKWASVFENRGDIYLLGSDLRTEAVIIVKVEETGEYEKAQLFASSVTKGTAPGVVLHANGRVYKAYHIASISATEDSDLMQPSSWTVSENTNTASLAASGREGSMVLGKDGEVYQVMIHSGERNQIYVLKLDSGDNVSYSNISTSGTTVEFPQSKSKICVVYDEVSEKYVALTNVVVVDSSPHAQRNVLALVASDDLENWEIVDYVLVEREMVNPLYSATMHAYQYPDFRIDGDDIVMVVREASGYTNTYHDGNYTSFYRIENFRNLLANS